MTARFVMGTFLRVHIEGDADAMLARRAFYDRIQELEAALSFFSPDSDISRINREAVHRPVPVHPETFDLLRIAADYAERTDGTFDPTFRSPEGVDYRSLHFDHRTRSVRFERPGLIVDLGAIGKGFALDRAAEEARSIFPVTNIVADFGGQWYFWSAGDIRERILVEDPISEGKYFSELEIGANCSVSTSSQAQRPGHLIDPEKKNRARGYLSATVIAPSGVEAEALSTALFVAGPNRSSEILSRFPGAKAVLH